MIGKIRSIKYASILYLIINICFRHGDLVAQPVYTSSDYRFQHYDMSDGLASELANEIVQDSLGFIWILHNNGLSRYDGYTFKVYMHDPNDRMSMGPPTSGFLELDQSGSLWLIGNQSVQPEHQIEMTKYDRDTDGFIKYYPRMEGVLVRSVCFDKNNAIVWMGSLRKGLYSFDILTGEVKSFSAADLSSGTAIQQWNAIFGISDRDSVLLLATSKGLWQFDKATKVFSHPKCHPADSSLLYNASIVAIIDPRHTDDLYVVIENEGLARLGNDVSEKATILFKGLSSPRKRSFQQDKDGIFWLTDYNEGLYRFDPRDGSLLTLKSDPSDPYSIRSRFLNGFTIDRDQNLWIATEDRGVSKLSKQSLKFYNYKFGAAVTGNTVYRAKEKNYLVVSQNVKAGDNEFFFSAVEPSGLEALHFNKLNVDYKLKETVTLLTMGNTHLWIGTAGMGTFGGEGVVGLPLNPMTGLIESGPARIFAHDPKNENTIRGYPNTSGSIYISGILEDQDSNLWVGSVGPELTKVRLNMPYGRDGSIVRYKHIVGDSTSLSNGITRKMYPNGKSSHWIITASGLDLFRNGSFEHYFKNDVNVKTVSMDSNGVLLVGTENGLYEGVPGEPYTFKKDPSKHLTHCYAFQEDNLGRLWISSSRSVRCYDRQRKVVVPFGEAEGFQFAMDWVEKTSDGVFVTADYQGVTLFDPHSFTMDEAPVFPVFTQLTVNNASPLIQNTNKGDDGFLITKDISILDELIIDYRHNNFTIEFSAMEMTAPEKNLYRHKLEGYDNDWIETDFRNRIATYTNLDVGDYIFKVSASNHHGIWSDVERTIRIKVLPPPWKTLWAYTGYLLIVIGLLLGARRIVVHGERLKANLKLEHVELEKAKEVDQLKSQFFANISHEFRTPITLVLGPLKDHYRQLTNPEQKSMIGSVIRNGQRLQRLINQLLDLSKVEAGKMKLHTSQIDMVGLLREITASYESLAKERNVRYFFYSEVKELMMYVDGEKMEKIVHNLLSNAFKFTQEGGEIIMYLRTDEKSVLISVSDSGIGIPNDQLDKIFDRFYQVDSSQTRGYEGSGLGLALVKDLVELHHGKISVNSKEGKGTTFTVVLPLGNDRLQKEEIVESGVFERAEVLSHDFISANGVEIEKEATKENETALEQPVVLIVEDNADMRQYIRKTLSSHYQIIEAENGREGVSKAEESMPDLIISDIMMPEMDGYKLCGIIKSKELTSHIPIILLTAKADRDSKLSGLEIGADDYLSKPFDAEELRLIVRNRIEERRKMKEHFSRAITLEPKQVSVTSMDEKFINKVLAMIERHMDDEEFSIEDFSQEAGCSRVQFYRKIKGLTDQTPSQFVRSIRLKRAAQLLAAKSDNVSQIAYSVGFSSLAYFNKCFKEQFGVTPGQFAEESLKSKI